MTPWEASPCGGVQDVLCSPCLPNKAYCLSGNNVLQIWPKCSATVATRLDPSLTGAQHTHASEFDLLQKCLEVQSRAGNTASRTALICCCTVQEGGRMPYGRPGGGVSRRFKASWSLLAHMCIMPCCSAICAVSL